LTPGEKLFEEQSYDFEQRSSTAAPKLLGIIGGSQEFPSEASSISPPYVFDLALANVNDQIFPFKPMR
jgi:hypothetical protein